MSNGLERSIKTPTVYSSFSKELVISHVSWSMACSVELWLYFMMFFKVGWEVLSANCSVSLKSKILRFFAALLNNLFNISSFALSFITTLSPSAGSFHKILSCLIENVLLFSKNSYFQQHPFRWNLRNSFFWFILIDLRNNCASWKKQVC